MKKQKPLLIANWKANPVTEGDAVRLAERVEEIAGGCRGVDIVVAPSYPFIPAVRRAIKRAFLGAQDAFWERTGAYTGAVSFEQLHALGVMYVIVGHSERRIHFGETVEMIHRKVQALTKHGFRVVLCIGERERLGDDIPQVIAEDLRTALSGVPRSRLSMLVVAYESVWAISTNPGGVPDTPERALSAKLYIRRILADLYGRIVAERVPIIYGGSVSAKNVAGFFREGGMQGALVGKASLNAEEFGDIARIAAEF